MKRAIVRRELSIFLALIALTVVMTWPWVLNLRHAVSDTADPYLHTYFMWWDYHQTFRSPTNLFDASIFYPYRNTLAFSENDYGISIFFFPLYAIGLRPITVHSLATLLAFAFSGYGMFRLTRTLTGSNGAAWISALVFAFVPYHFQRLPHLPLIFAGWIPLMLEALILFGRSRTWRRAIWLGLAFLMNALTCVYWFTLTLIPFALSGLLVLWWCRLARDRAFWVRGGLALGAGLLGILGFLYPYYQVHKTFGFTRIAAHAALLSAHPINWLAVSGRNKFWEGLGGAAATDELSLFPGLLPPLLAFAAFALLAPSGTFRDIVWKTFHLPRRTLLIAFDIAAAISLLVAFLTIGYGTVHFRLFGFELLRSSHATRPLILFAALVCVRLMIGVPEFVRRTYTESKFWASFRSNPRSLAFILAATWMVLGFFGSLGMNFPFHRLLFEIILPFRSIRAPARWAMICYVGLAILAGWGAVQVVRLVRRWLPRVPRAAVYAVLVALILFEQRVAPIQFARAKVDPDPLTIRLKQTPMSAGLVELPAERDNYAYSSYVLRAIDHGHPIVTASSSFSPPIVQQIEALTLMRPIPDSLLDLLEAIPASYLIVHKGLLTPDSREAIEWFIERGLASGRLRFVNSYGEAITSDDLYAVSKIEPDAKTEATRRTGITFVRRQYLDILAREPERAENEHWNKKLDACGNDFSCVLGLPVRENSALLDSPEFRETGGFVYSLYRALGRAPTHAEWERDRKRLSTSNARTMTAEWVMTREFLDRHPVSLPNSEYVDKLIQAVGPISTPAVRDSLVARLTQGRIDRAGALLEVITNSNVLRDDSSFVTLCYFVFLKRDPEKDAINYWVEILRNNPEGKTAVIRGFFNSPEYRTRKN